jgi:hypothetical protein
MEVGMDHAKIKKCTDAVSCLFGGKGGQNGWSKGPLIREGPEGFGEGWEDIENKANLLRP